MVVYAAGFSVSDGRIGAMVWYRGGDAVGLSLFQAGRRRWRGVMGLDVESGGVPPTTTGQKGATTCLNRAHIHSKSVFHTGFHIIVHFCRLCR